MPTDIPENRADSDPGHTSDHNQLHDLYNFFNNLTAGKVVVGSASPGTGTDMNIDVGDPGIESLAEDTTPQLGGNLDLNGNTITGMVIGTDVQAYSAVLQNTTASFTAADETKLDGIEAGATANQTGSEIKTAYEAQTDTNAFTDNEKTKLAGIEALADVTDATNVAAAGAPIVTSGGGAPSSTPANVGDIYVDTTSDEAYIATGTASSADWDAATADGGSGSTNLSYTAATRVIASDTGTDATLPLAVASGDAGLISGADQAKLDGIEASADVTDATNVDAAGAVMNSDTTTASMSFVIDEDTLASNLSTKVPSQQSVKAYVDALDRAGRIENTNTTVASFASGSEAGAYSVLTQADGGNPAGLYEWTGAAWTLRLSVPTFTLIDDDTFSANSATNGASQQSIKAYVDGEIATVTALNDNDGTYDAITHSASGALALDFNDSDVGWKVTASANITDITTANSPASGSMKRRTLEIVATAAITIAAASATIDADVPSSMANGDTALLDIIEVV